MEHLRMCVCVCVKAVGKIVHVNRKRERNVKVPSRQTVKVSPELIIETRKLGVVVVEILEPPQNLIVNLNLFCVMPSVSRRRWVGHATASTAATLLLFHHHLRFFASLALIPTPNKLRKRSKLSFSFNAKTNSINALPFTYWIRYSSKRSHHNLNFVYGRSYHIWHLHINKSVAILYKYQSS